jgi:hypothetical protein
MVGMGRSPAEKHLLAVTSTEPVLSLLAALGLAQTSKTALVVDLCGVLVLGGRTLSDIASEGPSLSDLSPGRSGVALLGSGPIISAAARSMVESMAEAWPAVVVRCHPGQWEGPIVPVRALLPGLLRVSDQSPAVWQPVLGSITPPGPGPVLPRLRSSLVRRLLAGRGAGRARWVRAWERVWSMPWG